MRVENRVLDIYLSLINPDKLDVEGVKSLVDLYLAKNRGNSTYKEERDVLKDLINEPLTSKNDLDWIAAGLIGCIDDVENTAGDSSLTSRGRFLTPGEKMVLDLFVALAGGESGVSNEVLAEELGISARSVNNYMSKIFIKEGVHSKSQLILKYYEKSR